MFFLQQDTVAFHAAAWQVGDLERAFDEMAQPGFHAYEHSSDLVMEYGDKAELLQELQKKYQMQLRSVSHRADVVYPDRKDQILSRLPAPLRFLKTMGASLLVFTTGERIELIDKRQDFKNIALVVNEAAKLCMDHDCYLCVQPQLDTRIQDEEDLDRLMNLVDTSEVFLCIDPAHLYRAELEPHWVVKTYGSCIKHVHLQDCYPIGEEDDGRKFCELGEGVIDFKALVKSLEQTGYRGEGTVHISESRHEPAERYASSLHYLEKILKEPVRSNG